MCTVSVVRPPFGSSRLPAGPALFRVVVNRDEERLRPDALPPVVTHRGSPRVVMPIDPQGTGTWVAATDAGLVFALLNSRDPAPLAEPRAAPSRGLIIPALLESRSVDEALERLLVLDLRGYRAWRLLVISASRLLQAEANAHGRARHMRSFLPARFVATSSSVQGPRAIQARTRLFHELVRQPDPGAQDAFHDHQWPDVPELSVRMDRPEARTVSRTTIEVFETGVQLVYQPLGACVRSSRVWLDRDDLRRGVA